MMSEALRDFETLVGVMTPIDDILFGVRLETETVAAKFDEIPVTCGMRGMYSVQPGLASFRVIFTVEADVLRSAMIDAAVNYSIPQDAIFEREVFFKFANTIATPHVRSYAQSILDALLMQMKLPGRLLPPVGLFEEGAFKAGNAPEFISAARSDS